MGVTFNMAMLGLLISGGLYFGRLTDVEVWVPSTGHHCTLPSLPAGRDFHSQEGATVCGGGYFGSPTRTSCRTLSDDGTWEVTTRLLEERYDHSSWASPSGTRLIGGQVSPRTSEKIEESSETSSHSFDLEYDTA